MAGGGFVDIKHRGSTSNVPPQKFTLIVFIATILSATGCLLFGYDTGIVSGSMIYIKDQFHLNSMWQELEVSITIIGACIFSLLAGPASRNFGRKRVILSASFIFMIGSIIMAISWERWSLLVGRFIAGGGIGFAGTVVPCYIAEVAPTHVRGSLVTMSYVAIVLGQLIAAIVAGLCSYLPEHIGWRYMLGIAAIPAFLQFFGFIFMPESPRWLVQVKRYEEAISVLKRVRGTDDVKEEFKEIKNECEEAEKMAAKSCISSLGDALANKCSRRALVVGCVLWATHEFSGINVMMYYTATIVQMSGVYDKTLAVWYAAGIDVVYTIATGIGIYLVEKMGRRKLLVASLIGSIISCAITGGGFLLVDKTSPFVTSVISNDSCNVWSSCSSCTNAPSCGYCFFDGDGDPVEKGGASSAYLIKSKGGAISTDSRTSYLGSCIPANLDLEGGSSNFGACVNGTILGTGGSSLNTVWAFDWCPSDYSWLIIVGVISYLVFFGPGLGAMSWTINSEIYPLESRAACNAFVMGVNWFTQTIVTLTFLTLTEVMGKAGVFWLYGACAVTGGTFLFFTLPETKGRSLEETGTLFSRGWLAGIK